MEPDEYARPRSMADLVVEQATAAPGEKRHTVGAEHFVPVPVAWLTLSNDELGRRVRDLIGVVA